MLGIRKIYVDGPSAQDLLEHVVRAAHHDEGLLFNNQYIDVTAARKLTWLVEAALPEFYREVVANELERDQITTHTGG